MWDIPSATCKAYWQAVAKPTHNSLLANKLFKFPAHFAANGGNGVALAQNKLVLRNQF